MFTNKSGDEPTTDTCKNAELNLRLDLRPVTQEYDNLIQLSQDFIGFARNTFSDFLCHTEQSKSLKSNGVDGKKKVDMKLMNGNSAMRFLNAEKNKRKMLKIMLKLKEEERVENGDFPALHLFKDCQLLARYVREEKLPYLVLRLLPGNQGYTMSLRRTPDKQLGKANGLHGMSSSPLVETICLSYDQTELLNYIDNEQIPPMLLDALDSNNDSDQFLDFFHYGRLFVEVQDFRRNASGTCKTYESRFVALRPTTQTLLNDLERITSFPNDLKSSTPKCSWSESEKVELESRLILATADPICLDPTPLVFLSSNNLQYEKKWFKTKKLQSKCRKYSQVNRNQEDKFEQLPAPKTLQLFDFLKGKNGEQTFEEHAQDFLYKHKTNYRTTTCERMSSMTPQSLLEEIRKKARLIEQPMRNETSLTKLEEYVMEPTEPEKMSTVTSISIYYRQIDDLYFGQLVIEKSNTHGHRTLSEQLNNKGICNSGTSCFFQLGNKLRTKKYIEHFIEILSEHGRKSIKITMKKPGEPPRVNYTRRPPTQQTQPFVAQVETYTQSPKKPKLSNTNLSMNAGSIMVKSASPVAQTTPTGQLNVNGQFQNYSTGLPRQFGRIETNNATYSPMQAMNSWKNANGQVYQTMNQAEANQYQANAQSNNLIANNPILNNLITSNTSSSATLLPIGHVNAGGQKITISSGPANAHTQIKPCLGNYMNERKNIETSITSTPVSIGMSSHIKVPTATRVQTSGSAKPGDTVAVILTTNQISNHISNNSNESQQSQIMQINTANGAPLQTQPSNAQLPSGMNISGLKLGANPNVRLHNLVSLGNVQSGATQCIALPISLMVSPASTSGTVSVSSGQATNQLVTSPAVSGSSNVQLVGLETKKEAINSQPRATNILLIDRSNSEMVIQPNNNTDSTDGTNSMIHMNSSLNTSSSMNGQPILSMPISVQHISTSGSNTSSSTTGQSAQNVSFLSSSNALGDISKGLMAKSLTTAGKYTAGGPFQIQLASKTLVSESNAATIQLSSTQMRGHMQKTTQLSSHLLIQPQAAGVSQQLIPRKVNPK